MTNKITHIKPEEATLTSGMVQAIIKEVANDFIKPTAKINTLKEVENIILVVLSMIRKQITENQEIIDGKEKK